MIWRLREAEPLTPRAIEEAAGILRMGLAGLGLDRAEADTLTGRLRTILVS